MKIFIGLVLTFLGLSFSINAQDHVLDHESASDSVKMVLTIIPFPNNYYRSEIDRSLAKNENIDFNSLRDGMKKELDRQLFMILKDDFTINSLLKNDTEDDRELLDYIYYSTASSYTNLETGDKVERGLINNGQIKEATIQEGQRYMKTVIHNPSFFVTVEEQVPSDLYLFIGELDILLPQTIDEKKSNRNIYVHFTLYNKKGELIDSGMITQVISERKCKSIKDVSHNGFAPIAYQFKNRFSTLQE